jgi:hypothetical protein
VKLNNCQSPTLYLKYPTSWFVTVQWISKLSAMCGKVVKFTPRTGGFMGGYYNCSVLRGEDENICHSEQHSYIVVLFGRHWKLTFIQFPLNVSAISGTFLTLTLSMYTYCCLYIFIVVYVFLLIVHVFLTLSTYSYCCLCILIDRPYILIVVYLYLLLSMYS